MIELTMDEVNTLITWIYDERCFVQRRMDEFNESCKNILDCDIYEEQRSRFKSEIKRLDSRIKELEEYKKKLQEK